MVAQPRKIALAVLNELNKGRRTLDSILEEVLADDKALSQRDKDYD